MTTTPNVTFFKSIVECRKPLKVHSDISCCHIKHMRGYIIIKQIRVQSYKLKEKLQIGGYASLSWKASILEYKDIHHLEASSCF